MSTTDFDRRTSRIWPLVAAGAAGVALGLRLAAFSPDIGLWGTGTNPSKAKTSEEAPAAAPPMLIHQGDAIFIPEGSPYRSRVTAHWARPDNDLRRARVRRAQEP